MNIRDAQFLDFTRKLQLTARQRKFLDDREVSAGKPLDITDMLAEARRKREAGETFAEYNSRMLRLVNRNDWRDHDKEYAKETGEDLDVNRSQSSGDKSWLP